MNIAERIQTLRKAKGISQEELADMLGVTRQAVSKWESMQSTPDIDKIAKLSEIFDASTDYILRGIEKQPEQVSKETEKGINPMIFTVIASGVNGISLFMARGLLTIFYLNEGAFAFAFAGMVLGCTLFALGQVIGRKSQTLMARRVFIIVNVWTLLFIPLMIFFNIISTFPGTTIFGFEFVKYYSHYLFELAFWVVYVAVGVSVDVVTVKRIKKNK